MKVNRLRVMGGAAVLAFGLSSCGASVPTSRVNTSTPDAATRTSGGAANAKVTPIRALSMADVKTAVAEKRSMRVHTMLTFSGGDELMPGGMPGLETTVTTDVENNRFAFTSASMEFPLDTSTGDAGTDAPRSKDSITVPGYEVRGQIGAEQIDLYLRKNGSESWTHVVAAASLSDEITQFSDPSQQLDEFIPSDIPGITMKPEGTVDYKGETMSRQVATIDFAEMLGSLGDEFKSSAQEKSREKMDAFDDDMVDDFFSSGSMAEALPKGTIEVIIDKDELPRKITGELSVGPTDAMFTTHSETTIDLLGDSDAIELPTADQIERTVKVDSADELADVLGDLMAPDFDAMLGGN